MTKTVQALIWAFVIIIMAVAARFGAIERDVATTLLIVMPALAWLSISRRGACGRPAGA
ncbi:MAG: hypothetical protein GW859_06740 [Sphingomonadales bacterium]|nr:hypothetical protein [Sphingomonadales bacterium]